MLGLVKNKVIYMKINVDNFMELSVVGDSNQIS